MRSAEQEGEAIEAKEVKEPKKELVTSGSLQRLLSRSSSEHNVRVRGGSKRHSLLYDVRFWGVLFVIAVSQHPDKENDTGNKKKPAAAPAAAAAAPPDEKKKEQQKDKEPPAKKKQD